MSTKIGIALSGIGALCGLILVVISCFDPTVSIEHGLYGLLLVAFNAALISLQIKNLVKKEQ
jgi:hypothetical protein